MCLFLSSSLWAGSLSAPSTMTQYQFTPSIPSAPALNFNNVNVSPIQPKGLKLDAAPLIDFSDVNKEIKIKPTTSLPSKTDFSIKLPAYKTEAGTVLKTAGTIQYPKAAEFISCESLAPVVLSFPKFSSGSIALKLDGVKTSAASELLKIKTLPIKIPKLYSFKTIPTTKISFKTPIKLNNVASFKKTSPVFAQPIKIGEPRFIKQINIAKPALKPIVHVAKQRIASIETKLLKKPKTLQRKPQTILAQRPIKIQKLDSIQKQPKMRRMELARPKISAPTQDISKQHRMLQQPRIKTTQLAQNNITRRTPRAPKTQQLARAGGIIQPKFRNKALRAMPRSAFDQPVRSIFQSTIPLPKVVAKAGNRTNNNPIDKTDEAEIPRSPALPMSPVRSNTQPTAPRPVTPKTPATGGGSGSGGVFIQNHGLIINLTKAKLPIYSIGFVQTEEALREIFGIGTTQNNKASPA